MNRDQSLLFYFIHQCRNIIRLRFCKRTGCREQFVFFQDISPEMIFLLHQVDRNPRPGCLEGSGQTGHPTTDDERWVVVDVEPVKPLKEPVSLAQIREDPSLRDIAMLRYNRLSVVPITQPEFRRILKLGQTSVR